MVTGLNLFRDHFAAYGNQYMLIGGSACDMLMRNAGLTFRATRDLDIVLCVEVLDTKFVNAFWYFVRDGIYQQHYNDAGKPTYYRFSKPENKESPAMIELFSRKPDILRTSEGESHLMPIPMDECSSLSAILMDDAYYAFIQKGKISIDSISLLDAEHLIPLKARAWIDLTKRKAEGQSVDSKSITKHRNDVFRLYQVVDPNVTIDIPQEIANDMESFLQATAKELINLKSLGIRTLDLDALLDNLRGLYLEGR